MNTIQTGEISPTPKKKEQPIKGLSFYDALKEIANGKRITRKQWEKDDYGYLGKDNQLYIHREGVDHLWSLHKIDMELSDYVIVLLN